MRNRLAALLIVGVALVFGLLVARQLLLSRSLPHAAFAEHKLRLLTYSSFMGPLGPGAAIVERFERECGCQVEVTTSSDAGLLLERLKLAQSSGVSFDVVLGLDQLLFARALRDFKWKEIPEDKAIHAPEEAYVPDPHFAVMDWSPLTFVYRKDDKPVPTKLDDLLTPAYERQFALEDPATSTPGLQFYRWIQALKGTGTVDWLGRFKPNINSISPNWAFAYGLFEKRQTRFVFSYLTSLIYHWEKERDPSFAALNLPEGHPVQVEAMAIPDMCRECGFAADFVRAVQSDWAQRLVMERNYMFPVRGGLVPGTVYENLPRLKIIRTQPVEDLSEWYKVFSP